MRQLSLLEQHRLRNPSATDAAHIERIAADVIAELDENPPVSLEVVASYRDIRSIREEEGLPFAGSLTPEDAGLVLRMRAEDSLGRRRFTGFHEIGHTFQPGYHDVPSFRCEEPRRLQERDAVEQLADVASTGLLLPRSHFLADVLARPFGIETVIDLAERYQASIEATALRYVELRPAATLLIVLAPGLRKEERGTPGAVPKLRVRYSRTSGRWPFVPQNKSAAEGGVLHRALLGELIHEPANLDDIGVVGVPCTASARVLGGRGGSGVFAPRVFALYEPARHRRDRRAK